MGFTRTELAACSDRLVPDLLGPNCRLLFVGINPGLWSAATGAHFARPGNRFWPALYRAGITDHLVDASSGMSDADREYLIGRGVGITNVVARATATAAELSATELVVGGRHLRGRVEQIGPDVVAVAGITAYRSAFGDRRATSGEQPERWGETRIWVIPNPSGLNAHETVDTLAASYREVAVAAGVLAP